MKIKLKRKYAPLFSKSSRYYVITGGRGSGKSFGLVIFLLMLTFEKGHTILFTRYTLKSANKSIIPEFINAINKTGANEEFEVTKDAVVNKRTGSKIWFSGIKTSSGNQTANLKSLADVTTWVLDEAEELIDENTFDTIQRSIRKKGIQNRIILILNPTTKEHFIYKRFFESEGIEAGSNETKGDTTYIHTTYLDNINNLDESFLNDIEKLKERNPKKFTHQILGGWLDKAEGVIFSNWQIGEYKQVGVPLFGQDYGFSIDPTTLIEVSVDESNKIIYLKEHYGKSGLSTNQIYILNKQFATTNVIYADSAEDRLIDELIKKGNNIIRAKKDAGSIRAGISLLLEYTIIVDPNSIEIHKEFNNYVWLDKKSDTPIDKWNHRIDPLRYILYTRNQQIDYSLFIR